ncbi:phosphoanhydride phosphohydrolase [Sphingomonas panacis]|uniref:Phosphoanhydride phosphohydrolase n=1 Tax=Sphingomonas panacis TaxID=1560345 RepID=A0A1B3ZC00_9SPHN|nr:histidine-type phosphatase [Sphingomonas panacis]AOH84935.1 phosphoanhydride phosphohydrolase [Sphingomonas panacis]
MRRSSLTLALALAGFGSSAALAKTPTLKLDRVVLMMRHGVRPPTKAPAMPASVTPERWPDWAVPPGWLTAHGTVAVTALGTADRAGFVAAGLLPANGCPAAGSVAIIADSDQRTIATADAWASGFAPGCTLPSTHKPQDVDDPVFSPLGRGATLDPVAVNAAVKAAIGPGGVAALDARYAPLLRKLDTILCARKPACGVTRTPTGLTDATVTSRPKLRGALDFASTAAQVLLLEYADGKPMADVGFGRASAADVTALSELHALEFRLLARPMPVARANLALITPTIAAALTEREAARVTVFSAHDTQIANLGGLLGVHWHVPGYAADDPAPGGAIVIERLRDAAGRAFVRVKYRAQPLTALRAGGGAPFEQVLSVPGCGTLCPAARFVAILRQ